MALAVISGGHTVVEAWREARFAIRIPSDSEWTELRLRAGPLRTWVDELSWTVTLSVNPQAIVASARGAQLEIPLASITAVAYIRDAYRATPYYVGNGFAPLLVPGRGAFGRSGAHLIAIEFRGERNETSGLLLEAKKSDYLDILRALSRATTLPVSLCAEDRERLPDDIHTKIVAEPPTGVFPGVPIAPMRWLPGHRKDVTDFVFSRDGTTLATGDADGTILLWKAPFATADASIETRTRGAIGLTFGADERTLIVWSPLRPALMTLYEIESRTKTQEVAFPFFDHVREVTFSSDKRFAVVTGNSPMGEVVVFVDLNTNPPAVSALAAGSAATVAFDDAGRWLIVWRSDGMHLWQVHPLRPLRTLNVERTLNTPVLTDDGAEILTVGGHQSQRIITATGEVVARLDTPEPGLSATISPDHRLAALREWKRSVSLLDLVRLAPFGAPLLGHRGEIVDMAFNHDGRLLVTASQAHAVVWDVQSQIPLAQCVTGPLVYGWERRGRESVRIQVSPDSRTLAVWHQGDSSIALCDLTSVSARSGTDSATARR